MKFLFNGDRNGIWLDFCTRPASTFSPLADETRRIAVEGLPCKRLTDSALFDVFGPVEVLSLRAEVPSAAGLALHRRAARFAGGGGDLNLDSTLEGCD